MNGYLTKPFQAHQLYAAVEGWSGDAAAAPTTDGTSTAAIDAARTVPVVSLDKLRGDLREAGAEAALDGIVATFVASVPERVVALRPSWMVPLRKSPRRPTPSSPRPVPSGRFRSPRCSARSRPRAAPIV